MVLLQADIKEDTIQHLAGEMEDLQEQHRDVLSKVGFSSKTVGFSQFSIPIIFFFFKHRPLSFVSLCDSLMFEVRHVAWCQRLP